MATIYYSINRNAGTNAGTCAGDLSTLQGDFDDSCSQSEIDGGNVGYASKSVSCPTNGTPGCSGTASPSSQDTT